MAKKEIMIVADYSEESPLSLAEICHICKISPDYIYDLINYDIIQPKQISQKEWLFNLNELKRIKRTLRIQRDLEINLAGIAMVLDLLDRIKTLEAQMKLFEKHYL